MAIKERICHFPAPPPMPLSWVNLESKMQENENGITVHNMRTCRIPWSQREYDEKNQGCHGFKITELRCYERPILIIEGEDPFFSGRTVNPESIKGILKTIAISFRVPTLFMFNEAETAEVIPGIARLEHLENGVSQENLRDTIKW